MKVLTVEQKDGSLWGVPVYVIARDRAKHYASEFGGDVERSLAEDTLLLFEASPHEVKEWAANQMNWSDVARYARKIKDAPPPDFQEAWMTGAIDVIDYSRKDHHEHRNNRRTDPIVGQGLQPD